LVAADELFRIGQSEDAECQRLLARLFLALFMSVAMAAHIGRSSVFWRRATALISVRIFNSFHKKKAAGCSGGFSVFRLAA